MKVSVYPAQNKIVIPFRSDLANIVPNAKTFQHAQTTWLALPYKSDVVKLLCNYNISVPDPILTYYDWANTTPFASQKTTAALLAGNHRAYVLSSMGVGKTRAGLFAFDWLRRQNEMQRALVVAPLSTLVAVWENEIFDNFPALQAVVLYGTAAKRRKLLSTDADIYIINHDGVEVLQKELLQRKDIDCLIIDELATYRNSSTVKWKAIQPIAYRTKYVWGLTGSPTPKEPTDAYGQVKLLTPNNVGRSFRSFRLETMRQLSQFTWVPKPEANDIVRKAMSPSVRFTREQCFDLPPTTYSTREVQLDTKADKVYKELKTRLALKIKNKEVNAANEAVLLSKLLQVAAGFVYSADKSPVYIGGVQRTKAIVEIAEGCDSKLIVWAPFTFQAEMLHKVLNKYYPTELVLGSTPKNRRDVIFTTFQRSTEPRILVAHPVCAAHGLTLTAADTIVWASPTLSLEIYEQANARITRPSQTRHTHIIQIQSTPIEKQVYSRLRRKAKMQGALLELFEKLI